MLEFIPFSLMAYILIRILRIVFSFINNPINFVEKFYYYKKVNKNSDK